MITSSGAIATLLLALAAFVIRETDLDVGALTQVLIGIAAASFAVAASLGVWVNRPAVYRQPNVDWLERLLAPEYWNAAAEIGSRRAAESMVRRIRVAQEKNERKAKMLKRAVAAEAFGIAAVAASVVSLIVDK